MEGSQGVKWDLGGDADQDSIPASGDKKLKCWVLPRVIHQSNLSHCHFLREAFHWVLS